MNFLSTHVSLEVYHVFCPCSLPVACSTFGTSMLFLFSLLLLLCHNFVFSRVIQHFLCICFFLSSSCLHHHHQIRGHELSKLDPLGINDADLSSAIPWELTLSNYHIGKEKKVTIDCFVCSLVLLCLQVF